MQTTTELYQPETTIEFHKDIRLNPKLGFGERIFLSEIISISQKSENKVCPYSSRKLSDLFGVSHQAILNWIRKLTEAGWIEIGIDFNNKECRHFIKPKKYY